MRRGSNSTRSRPSTENGSRKHHDCLANNQRDAATQISQKIRVSSVLKRLKAKQRCPTNMEALPDTSSGEGCREETTRPKSSSNNVLQYADKPIEITQHHLGRPTRATILRNLKRAQSASSICSELSWLRDNRRLCNVRDYYRLFKGNKVSYDTPDGEPIHSFMTGARFNGAHWLDTHAAKSKGLFICKEDLDNVFFIPNLPVGRSKERLSRRRKGHLLEVKGEAIMKDASVNTGNYYLAMDKWHGASWQRHLPEVYLPVEEKYNPYASVVVRAKQIKSEYRNPVDVASLEVKRKSLVNQREL